MNLFIDTNIFLSFYELSPESLIELEKLTTLIKRKEATLWLPDQIKREFWKNREYSVSEAIKNFENQNLVAGVPTLIREEALFQKFREKIKEIEKIKTELVSKIQVEMRAESTKADKAVKSLFAASTEIDSAPYVEESHIRALRHLPPGKDEGLGDRLNWVSLLKKLPTNTDIHIISDDGDFESSEERGTIKPYLRAEYKSKNGGAVTLWKRLSQFMAKNFPNASTAIAFERALAVKKFVDSPSFSRVHLAVAGLSDMSDFTPEEIQQIASAVIENSQIKWVASDSDVKSFLEEFLTRHESAIDNKLVAQIRKAME